MSTSEAAGLAGRRIDSAELAGAIGLARIGVALKLGKLGSIVVHLQLLRRRGGTRLKCGR